MELKRSSWYNKPSKRLGRWNGSGKGNYSTKGLKWQKARSWGGVPNWFEWGQTPLTMKLPKLKGFKRPEFMRKRYQVVNLVDLENSSIESWTTINKEVLKKAGLIKTTNQPVKILWNGWVEKTFSFSWIEAFTSSAKEKLTQKWGKID